jgi:integrase
MTLNARELCFLAGHIRPGFFTRKAPMARPSSPWYREDRDAWYVNHGGKQVRLCKGKANRKEAYRAFLKLSDNAESTPGGRCTASDLLEHFLRYAKANLKPNTYRGYEVFITPFVRTVRRMGANQVMPKHVTAYMNSKAWGKTTRFNAITAIKRCWRWGHGEGHIMANQLANMKKPRPERHTEIPDDKEVARFLREASPDFREILTFIYLTGCRPGEASMIERRHVNLAHKEVRFKIGEDKTSGKTGKPRVIHLNAEALATMERLCSAGIVGPLFRNARGNPWTSSAMACSVKRLRMRTGLDSRAVAYALRHQWITDALARGVPISTVAEMTGTSPEMIARVYSHLSVEAHARAARHNPTRVRGSSVASIDVWYANR